MEQSRWKFVACSTFVQEGAHIPRTVLVVEDEPIIRAIVVDALRDVGILSLQADSADEAVIYLRSGTRIDLVFTDVQMPGAIDGAGLALLMASEFASVPVIVTSATARVDNLPQSTLFLPKPYRMGVMIERICEAIVRAAP